MDGSTRPAVVLTREPEDNRDLAAALRERGVPVREIPCVSTRYVVPALLPGGEIAAVTFSSRRGVRGVIRQNLTRDLLPPGDDRVVAAVGQATAAELGTAGIHVDLVAEPPEGRVLAGLLVRRLGAGARVAVVRGNLRAGEMDAALEAAGFRLVPVEVYENREPDIPVLAPFPVAAVFVASPSAARRLVEKNPWLAQHPHYTIGATTASALPELGVGVVAAMGPEHERWVEILEGAFHRAIHPEER